MYFAADTWNIFYTCVRSIWSAVLFKASVSLISFLSGCLSIIHIWVLKSPTFIGWLSSFPFSSFKVCFLLLGVLMGAYVFTIAVSFWKIGNCPFISSEFFTLRLFSLTEVWPLCSLWVIICMEKSFFNSFTFILCVPLNLK